ncbi:MAG TPA: NAD(P)/FAD-dependent oxidoreductase [Clostridia bacterium]|nr:NAD(P)/FAD-dependent oxidoreductase [Clostridia bacterium]
MDCDVLIVGAGPVGSFAAETIAASGFKVVILEEHKTIGEPLQCAGLISPRAVELAGVGRDIVINEIRGLRVFSPLGGSLHAESNQVFSLAVDRALLDQKLAERAENAGALLLTKTRVTGLEPVKEGYHATAVRDGRTINIKARLVIGADGIASKTAQWLGLGHKNPRAVMYSAEIKLPRNNTASVDVFLGHEFAPGWFGWLIPLDENTCRVGTGCAFMENHPPPRYYFEKMAGAFPEIFRGLKVLRYTGGSVPLGPMPKIFTSHAMLVGDAASQTKPISGGGIYTGLRAAQICAETAVGALMEEDLTENRLYHYQEQWNKEMGGELNRAMGYRKSFLNLSDKNIDLLIRFLNKPMWLNTILHYGDIDYPSRLALKMCLLNPLARVFFRNAGQTTTPSFPTVKTNSDSKHPAQKID